jgi:hypothetical protein
MANSKRRTKRRSRPKKTPGTPPLAKGINVKDGIRLPHVD